MGPNIHPGGSTKCAVIWGQVVCCYWVTAQLYYAIFTITHLCMFNKITTELCKHHCNGLVVFLLVCRS